MTKRKNPEDYVKVGAPELPFNQEMANRICDEVSSTSDGLNRICSNNPDFPCKATIRKWRMRNPGFASQYAEAKRQQAENMAEDIIDISDDDSRDEVEGQDGKVTFNSEFYQRSRLRVDTRKWIASKLIPKVYGDKIQNEVTAVVRHEDALKVLE